MNQILRVHNGLLCQRMSQGNGGINIPLMQFPEMQTPVPVGRVNDGHIQLFLAHQIHEYFCGAFRQMEPDTAVLPGIF